MSSAPVPQRMSRLEEALAELAVAQVRTQDELGQLAREMREFKDESRRASRDADRRLGELTNSLGRLVEDIVGPSVPEIFRSLFGTDAADTGIRRRRQHPDDPGRSRELDAFAAGGDAFLVVEVKSSVRPEDIPAFADALPELRTFFPDQALGRRLIGAIASFHADKSLVAAAERRGLLVFGLARNLIEIFNNPGFQPRAF
jgi:hypothetical protein